MNDQIRPPRLLVLIVITLALIVLAGLTQVAIGSYGMSFGNALGALCDGQMWCHPGTLLRLVAGEHLANLLGAGPAEPVATSTLIVWNVRLPRVLVAVMVGINLSYSGSIFQAITRNELASPYLLGVSSGAGLGILLILVLFPAMTAFIPPVAMAGGALAFLVVYGIAWNRGTSSVRLVLAGVIVAAIAGSLQTALFLLSGDLATMQNAVSWTTGSLTGVGWVQVRLILPWTLISVILAFAGARHLDVLMLGDANARALGMSVERVRFILAGTAIIAAGSAVAVAGLVGFVGLIVPHVVRNLVGSQHRRLLIGCLFAGPALLVGADAVARLLFRPIQIPVGIVTGVLGGLFFLYLMRRRREIGKI